MIRVFKNSIQFDDDIPRSYVNTVIFSRERGEKLLVQIGPKAVLLDQKEFQALKKFLARRTK